VNNFKFTGVQNVLKQDVSETSGPIAAPANEALDLASKTRHKTEHTSLEKLEAGLQKARVALKEAKNGKQADDPDYAPAGPMYWNAEVFHRFVKLFFTAVHIPVY
jgi:hypothetical protein